MKEKLTPQYLAGLFDADGLFSMHIRKDNYIMAHVSFIMNSVDLLETLQQKFPFSRLYFRKPGKNKHGVHTRKQVAEWRLSSRKAKEFVDMIYPHVIIKREDLNWYFKWYNLPRIQGQKSNFDLYKERQKLIGEYKIWRNSNKG